MNIQKWKKLYINTSIHAVEFTGILTKKPYEISSKDVIHNWDDDMLTHTRFKNISIGILEDLPKKGERFLHIIYPNSELLKDIDSKIF